MTPFAAYYKERFGWSTLERDGGFIVFDLKPPNASIEEFFVPEEKRCTRLAKSLADDVFAVAESAGVNTMWAKVTPGTNGAEHALRTNLHYGFKLAGVRDGAIILVKDIGGSNG